MDMETTDLKYKEITEICLFEIPMKTLNIMRKNLQNEKNFSKNPLKFEEIQALSNIHKLLLIFKPKNEISEEATQISIINNTSIKNFQNISVESCLKITQFIKCCQ